MFQSIKIRQLFFDYNLLIHTIWVNRSRPPDPSKQPRVIGAGVSRTGTLSFTLAFERLFNGPVDHGGESVSIREETHIKRWIAIWRHTPLDLAWRGDGCGVGSFDVFSLVVNEVLGRKAFGWKLLL